MNNTIFKIEEFHTDDQDDSKEESDDFSELNIEINQNTNDLNYHLNKKLNNQFKQNLNYQLNQQIKNLYTQQQFKYQLNQRLNQHLLKQNSINKLNNQFKKNKINQLKQSKLSSFFICIFNYYKNSLIKLNLNIFNLINYFLFWLNFLIIDIFHYFIFKFILNNNYQRIVLINWLNKVTNNKLIKQNLINIKFIDLFSDGKLLCGLINYLNLNSCSRYDLLDIEDVDLNLELAYRLIYTYYGIDEKLNLFNLNSNEKEQRIINLISKIRYLEIRRSLCSKYGIENDNLNNEIGKNLIQDNYLIRGSGIFVGVTNRSQTFNIFYFKFIDVIIEICGPNNLSYACKRVKIDNFKLIKQPKNYFNEHIQKSINQLKEIPLKFEIKKQIIEITYIPLYAGYHRISIVHQGNNILNSPYNVKIDENNLN